MMILKYKTMGKTVAILALLVFLYIQCNAAPNDQKAYDCRVSWSMMQVFLNDTGNKKVLEELDSQLMLCYLQDSNNHQILTKIKITKAHKHEFGFLVNRIYPKLYKTDWQFKYELCKILEFKCDSILLCSMLSDVEVLLRQTDFNDIKNKDKLISYIDVIYQLKGEDHVENFIKTQLTNVEILDYINDVRSMLKTIKKWHKYPLNCK